MEEIIKNANNKQYTAFADAVKTELKDKLTAHPEVTSYTAELDYINDLKSAFSEINNPSEE